VATGRVPQTESLGGDVRKLFATVRCAGERGATAVEYALMAGLIALVIVAGVTLLGQVVRSQFDAGAGLFS
jgi:Flp pilus assembly pilin Flp